MANQLEKGRTFNPGDTVEAADLNNLVDAAAGMGGLVLNQPAATPVATDSVLFYDADAAPPDRLRRCTITTLATLLGGVESVVLTMPSTEFNVDNTGSGGSNPTPDVTWKTNIGAGKVLAAPAASSGTPTFRVLSPSDLPVATITIPLVAIDWNLGVMFTKTLTTNTTFTFTGASAGQTIRVLVIQDASHTVAWPPTARWPGGTNPVMTTGAGARDLYTFHFIGGLYYGTFEQNFLV